LRVIAVMLEPALRLAHFMAIPIDDLQELVADGYFREARFRGLSLRGIARRFGKSLRTVASLSRRATAHGLPMRESLRMKWRRQVVAYVAAKPNVSAQQIGRAVRTAEPEMLSWELQQLVEAGLLLKKGRVFRVDVKHMNTVAKDFDARLDSLRHFLS